MLYDDIFLFVKLINSGSFSKLSQSVNISQGTISKRIQSLEEELHLQLIKRNSRGLLELSPEGESLYNSFSIHEDKLKESLEEVISLQNIVKGSIHVALPLMIYNKIILPHLDGFIAKYPEAKIIISFTGNQIELLKDNFNLAVTMQQPQSQSTKIKLLQKSRIKLFASKTYIEKHGAPIQLDELSQHNIAGLSINRIPQKEFKVTNIHTDMDQMISYESSIYINNAIYNIEMATKGEFIISIAELFVANDIACENMVPILPDYSFGDLNFFLIRPNQIHNKLEQVFAEFIEYCFSHIK